MENFLEKPLESTLGHWHTYRKLELKDLNEGYETKDYKNIKKIIGTLLVVNIYYN